MKAYEHLHTVSFEETNLVGNVYYVNYLRWQGRCRELFLRDHAPDVLQALQHGLAMVTTRCACDFLAELVAFDEIVIRMRLGGMTQNRITMMFEYWRRQDDKEDLVARGEQQIACMLREGNGLVAAPVPESLRNALKAYAAPELVRHQSI